MPWHIKFSDRDATCHICRDKIEAFDARFDYERASFEAPESQQAGWHTLRICMPCGVPLLDADALETAQRAREARTIWNRTRERLGRHELKPIKGLNGKTKDCTVTTCSAKALLTLKKRGCGKLYVCPEGHFWTE
jgi:hypothetical protein